MLAGLVDGQLPFAAPGRRAALPLDPGIRGAVTDVHVRAILRGRHKPHAGTNPRWFG